MFKAAALQWDVVRGDLDHNLERAEGLVQEAAENGVQLGILPEMWATSFMGDAGKGIQPLVDRAEERLRALSGDFAMVLVGSNYETSADGRVYNRASLYEDGRKLGEYRKAHLFTPLGEDRWFTPGDDLSVFPTRVGRLGIAICYDLRFPEFIRLFHRKGAQILALCSQWPEARATHFRRLGQVRAIENQFWVLASNRCGMEPSLVNDQEVLYPGNSMLVDPTGQVLKEGNGEPGLVEGEIDLKANALLRRAIPVEKDRREDLYRKLWEEYWNEIDRNGGARINESAGTAPSS